MKFRKVINGLRLFAFYSMLVVVSLSIFSCGNSDDKTNKKEKKITKEPEFLYGICIDSMDVEIDTIKRNQFLSDIMLKKDINYNVIAHIEKNHRKVFDIRKIKPGQRHTFLISRDSIPTPVFWVYEINRTDYAVFSLTDSLTAWLGHKEVETRIEYAEGVIESSLWEAMTSKGYDPYLTLKLSDIYAWTVDFFGIQPGDTFKVVYENKYLKEDNSCIGIGNVLASYLKNSGEGHYAYYFEQNGKGEFFDENGANLRKAFLKAPLNYRRISSTFSHARKHPVTKVVRPHHGVDYAAPTGTPVVTIADGTVIEKGWDKKGGGNYLKVKHNSTYTTTYMHLNGFAKGIQKGSKVKQGDLIGYVGSTGMSTGPHLDFRLCKNGTYINPLTFESPSAEPVKEENIAAFEEVLTIRNEELGMRN
ncbi:MAG: peptidoglycan DD-metalloendopeptidase family protein [Bacteroidales bacterium]|nr:peptidoglycan DD-metalloendopeptidase family protein [Bacteroidales bacterium]